MPQADTDIIAAFQAKLDELVTAIEASNWAAAYTKLVSAKALRAKLVTGEMSDQGSSLKNSDDMLARMTDLIAAAESSASKHSGVSRLSYARNTYGAGGYR